ncbi:hypothetical protein Pyn_40715 [Prunus yedoensis var. nudiflora]|uniref:Uncharacterized protein n=1 Tax=Prunus yedoensis var. nudiflora TaxID=2094558 RepID=A0A315AM00_PRUYE|nr:hypothetical protein Pyn_40715 [Prunus yedoensis var. nudiflora]
MVSKTNGVCMMSVFILLLLFASKVAFARVSQFSETKEKMRKEFPKMKNINLAKKIDAGTKPKGAGRGHGN